MWNGIQARQLLLLFGVHQIIQEVNAGSAATAAPEKFWERQILEHHPRSTELELVCVRLSEPSLNKTFR